MPIVLLIIFLLLSPTVQGDAPLFTIKTDLEDARDPHWINLSTVIRADGYSGTHFSRADSLHCYGIGYESLFPSAAQNKSLNILIRGRFRTHTPGNSYQVALTVAAGDSSIYWASTEIGDKLKDSLWTIAEAVFRLPSNVVTAKHTIKVFVWNTNCRGNIDTDDFELVFTSLALPTYLPVMPPSNSSNRSAEKLYIGSDFMLALSPSSGLIIIDKNNDTIVRSFKAMTEWRSSSNTLEKETGDLKLMSKSDSSVQLSLQFSFGIQLLSFNFNRSAIKVHSVTSFQKEVSVGRMCLILEFTQPFSEAISATGLRYENPVDELWLGKEGFVCNGKSFRTVIFKPDVSSVQIDGMKRIAVLNLDYAADHPMLHFPSMKKSEGKYIDRSNSLFKKGDTLSGSFSMVCTQLEDLPVLSRYPDGYSAAFIWTEHADFSNLRMHKAIYYGADTIDEPSRARGGFIRHRVPVTKSIFFQNPTGENTVKKHAAFAEPSASYKSTPGFAQFLRDIHRKGNEICLHSPDPFTTTLADLELSLKTMKDEFGSKAWIDHGYDNGPESNREDLNCDGFEPRSKLYAAPLWEKYGLKYFWNSFYEDSSPYSSFTFNSFFSKPYFGWGERFPYPVYWQHLTRTGNAYHWRTNSTTDFSDGRMWSYYFSDQRLNDLCFSRQTEIAHFYGPRVDSTNGFYRINERVIDIEPEFDMVLKKLNDYREKKKIWLTTISDYMDFQSKLDRLKITITPEGIVHVANMNRESVQGATLLVPPGVYSVRMPDQSVISTMDGVLNVPELPAGEQIQLIPLIR